MATQGTCKWFDSKKGIGFIARADGSGDVFVHQSSINTKDNVFRKLLPGETVTFNVTQDDQGRDKAVEVSYDNAARQAAKSASRAQRSARSNRKK